MWKGERGKFKIGQTFRNTFSYITVKILLEKIFGQQFPTVTINNVQNRICPLTLVYILSHSNIYIWQEHDQQQVRR